MSSSQALDWRKLFDSSSEQKIGFFLDNMPIWVRLGLVPLELFTQKGLSYIASVLGTPFYMDNITTLQQRLACVKVVCLEISIDFELSRFINVELHDGSFVSIGVEVLWLQMRCLQCQSFSHSGKHCSKKNKMKV
ncbi:reverse transcriptase [Gossypium australe]|uniref:Reverse transcriptase n=1 Tax=Gossypium australe TaxID=47621 RepID=A0A5B6VMJ4_9ROSI|nr:reverse transcriptase [Gossypium australe]